MYDSKKTLKQQVDYILGQFPETRNSDTLLTVKLWEHFCHDKLSRFGGEWFVKVDLVGVLPREDHIKRVRATIQNVEKRHLPTNWDVARQRKWAEEEWKAFLRDAKPSIPLRVPQFDRQDEDDKPRGQSALLGGL